MDYIRQAVVDVMGKFLLIRRLARQFPSIPAQVFKPGDHFLSR